MSLYRLSPPDWMIHKITDLTTPITEPGPQVKWPDPWSPPGPRSALQGVEALRYLEDSSWSPDGEMLAFSGLMDGPTADMYLYDAADGSIARVSRHPTQDVWPSWPPHGNSLEFFAVSDFFRLRAISSVEVQGVWFVILLPGDGIITGPSSVGDEFPSSADEHAVILAWRDGDTAVVGTEGRSCCYEPHLQAGNNTVFWDDTLPLDTKIHDAAAASWDGTNASPVIFAASTGVFFLPRNSNQIEMLSTKPAGSAWWDEDGDIFVVEFRDGSVSAVNEFGGFEEQDASVACDRPVDVALHGTVWAKTCRWDEEPGVWIAGLGKDVGKIFSGPAYAPVWDLGRNLLFLSKTATGVNLYRATRSSRYQDVRVVAHFDPSLPYWSKLLIMTAASNPTGRRP